MTLAQLKRISKDSFYKTCIRNQIVIDLGVLPEYIYVVFDGEFQIEKRNN